MILEFLSDEGPNRFRRAGRMISVGGQYSSGPEPASHVFQYARPVHPAERGGNIDQIYAGGIANEIFRGGNAHNGAGRVGAKLFRHQRVGFHGNHFGETLREYPGGFARAGAEINGAIAALRWNYSEHTLKKFRGIIRPVGDVIGSRVAVSRLEVWGHPRRLFGLFEHGFGTNHHDDTAFRHGIVFAIGIEIVPNNRAFGQTHVPVDDGAANARMAADIHVIEND